MSCVHFREEAGLFGAKDKRFPRALLEGLVGSNLKVFLFDSRRAQSFKVVPASMKGLKLLHLFQMGRFKGCVKKGGIDFLRCFLPLFLLF